MIESLFALLIFVFFQLGSGQTHKIILEFLPQQFPGKIEVLVFINDKDEKNEETFCVKANYQ